MGEAAESMAASLNKIRSSLDLLHGRVACIDTAQQQMRAQMDNQAAAVQESARLHDATARALAALSARLDAIDRGGHSPPSPEEDGHSSAPTRCSTISLGVNGGRNHAAAVYPSLINTEATLLTPLEPSLDKPLKSYTDLKFDMLAPATCSTECQDVLPKQCEMTSPALASTYVFTMVQKAAVLPAITQPSTLVDIHNRCSHNRRPVVPLRAIMVLSVRVPPRPPDGRYTAQEQGASLPPSTPLSASREEPRCSWLRPVPTRPPDQCKLGPLPVSSCSPEKTNVTVNADGQVALASQPRQLWNRTTRNLFSHGYVEKEPRLYNSVDTSRFEGDTATGLHNLLMDSIAWLGGYGLVANLGGVWEIIYSGATYWRRSAFSPGKDDQNTYVSYGFVVIHALLMSLQRVQGLDRLTVPEPQGMYWTIRHIVTWVQVLNAHVQWDPGGFLSTIGGGYRSDHIERSWRMWMIGAQGYRLSQHEHAIAWGQAMFCRGGSVTPGVIPRLHMKDGLGIHGPLASWTGPLAGIDGYKRSKASKERMEQNR